MLIYFHVPYKSDALVFLRRSNKNNSRPLKLCAEASVPTVGILGCCNLYSVVVHNV